MNISVHNLSFDNFLAKSKKKKYDFITLIHVIEHVKNPVDMLVTAARLLNTKGLLYIETPNIDSHLFSAEKYNYTFLTPPDHLWLFSPKSFQTLLNTMPNLETVKISTYSYPEHFVGILKKIFKAKESQTEFIRPVIQEISGLEYKSQSLNRVQHNKKLIRKLKYMFFDRFVASILTPLLNFGNKGSILELYIKKI